MATPSDRQVAGHRNLQPQLTPVGREKYLQRARDTCGPVQLTAKVKAVGEAYNNGDWRMLSGALADLAAVSVAWEKHIREEKAKGYRDERANGKRAKGKRYR